MGGLLVLVLLLTAPPSADAGKKKKKKGSAKVNVRNEPASPETLALFVAIEERQVSHGLQLQSPWRIPNAAVS